MKFMMFSHELLIWVIGLTMVLVVEMAAAAVDVPIYSIQGASHRSPWVGQQATTLGVVTAVESRGFYLQDAFGDGDPETSDGIFVFTSSTPPVERGDEVQVSGEVSEFIPGGPATHNLSTTEIVRPEIVVVSRANSLPNPVILGEAGRMPPTEIIDDDGLTEFQPDSDGIDFYESLEGMRVAVADAVVVSPRNRFGEIWVLGDGGQNTSGLNARGGVTITSSDFNPERIQLQLRGDLVGEFAPDVNVGDRLSEVVGVVDYSFGNFEIRATDTFQVMPGSLEAETSPLIGDKESLTVASYNVLNLDPNDEDGDADLADGRFDAIARQTVENLNSPDIIGLQEIQDNDGSVDSSIVDASQTFQLLVEAIQAAGGPVYEFADLPPVDDQDGGEPGGNIRVGFLWNPKRVKMEPASLQRLTDEDLADGDAFEDARKPLAARFRFRGRRIWIVNVHFSSKSESTPLFGQIQPPVNGGLEKRVAQAWKVRRFIEQRADDDPRSGIVVLGDFNEFQFNPPLAVMEGDKPPFLTNLTRTIDPIDRYSFIFEGNSQALDHILMDTKLAGRAEFDGVHVNSKFQRQASDHEPLLARIHLPAKRTGVNK